MILKMVPNVNAHPNANATINHVPGMLAYTDYQNGKLVKVPIDKIISAVDDNIKKYGYSVIQMTFCREMKMAKYLRVVHLIQPNFKTLHG